MLFSVKASVVLGGNEHSYGAMVRCLLASPLIMPTDYTSCHGRELWLTITSPEYKSISPELHSSADSLVFRARP